MSNELEQDRWRKTLFNNLSQAFLAAPRMTDNPNAYIGCISAAMDLAACCIDRLYGKQAVSLDLDRSPIDSLSQDVQDWRFAVECLVNSFFLKNIPSVRNSVLEELRKAHPRGRVELN